MDDNRLVGRRALILMGAAASLASAACAPALQPPAGTLKVASQKGNTRALVEAAGVLEGAPYRVAWSEFGAASPLLEALGAGAVDIGGVGDAPFLFAFAAGAKIKAVFAYRSAAAGGSVAIVTRTAAALRLPTDLKGRRVATTKGSVGHYLLLRVLDRAHLPLDAAKAVFLNPGDCKAALQTGAVDAWATWAPYIGLATLHDANRVLVDGRGLFAGYSFMAACEGAIAAKRPLLSDFVRRLAKAYAWGRANPGLYAAALARDTGMPLDVAADSIARQNVSPSPITPGLAKAERATLDLFRRAGVTSGSEPIDGAFDSSFNAAWST
jgi:sulfonate transport system substrate-binding protein